MGHMITYMDFPRNATTKQMIAEREMYIADNGDYECSNLLSSDNGFKLHESIICDSWDEAVRKIDSMDNGWYDDHGVLYRSYSKCKPTKAMLDIQERISKNDAARVEFEKSHMPNRVKAEYIGCPTCGSKIAKKYLMGVNCPVCHKDLRPKSTLDRIKGYKAKGKELEQKYAELEKKMSGKAEVRWCVKLEFHV